MRKRSALLDQAPYEEEVVFRRSPPSLSMHRADDIDGEIFRELVKKLSKEPFKPDKMSITLAVEPGRRPSIVNRFNKARQRYQDLLKQVGQVRGYRHTVCFELNTRRRRRRRRATCSTLTLSIAPFDERAFVRIDFNPTKLRKAGRAAARKIIRQILGTTCFNRIWQYASVTMLEAAKIGVGVGLNDMLFYKKGSKVVEVFMGDGAASDEVYLRVDGRGRIAGLRMNSLKSRFCLKVYDLDAWLRNSIRLGRVPRFRLELVFKHTKLSPARLAQLQVPDHSILVFNSAALDQIFDDPSLRLSRPYFVAACRWMGFQNAVASLPRWRKAMVLGKLERDLMQVVSIRDQWVEQWPAVADRAFRFLRPVATRSKRTA